MGSEFERLAWDDRSSRTFLKPGLGAHGTASVLLGGVWCAGVSAGYDWIPSECRLNVGPNRVAFDLSGYTLSAQVGRQL